MMSAKENERNDLFRYELMKPFEYKFQCIGIPLTTNEQTPFDIVSYAPMMGTYAPNQVTPELESIVASLSQDSLWNSCEECLNKVLSGFVAAGITPNISEYLFTLLLIDPNNPMHEFLGDCCGDGGFPGYILGTIHPTKDSIKQLPATLAHEMNHNIRWQFQPWHPANTLADYIVSEGIAEYFEEFCYGSEFVGKWATTHSEDVVRKTIAPLLNEHLYETDFKKIQAYLYGDSITAMQQGTPLGVPDYAGYSYGYYLIKDYIAKTDKTIYETTILKTEDIIQTVLELSK